MIRNGAILINKPPGLTSFGIIEWLRDSLKAQGVPPKQWPKLGHGGTLDPFATGLLVILVGDAAKLARYFLGANKGYSGVIRFGETTIPGDPTEAVTERSDVLPPSLEGLQEMARKLTSQPYLQTPPMHSAKKKDGKPLYELARAGVEIDREPVLCNLHQFEIQKYEAPNADFSLLCSSGTYVRTLAQDFSRLLGTVGLLQTLHRTRSGSFNVADAWTLDQISESMKQGLAWNELPCWVPFDRLLLGYDSADATEEEATALLRGRQNVIFGILKRVRPASSPALNIPAYPHREKCLAVYHGHQLIAVVRQEQNKWQLERVFSRGA
jgi:tRNA pseudouridine55 synthase